MASKNKWANNLPNQIFSLIKARAEPKIKKNFPNVNITDKGKSATKAVFPTVYIKTLSLVEMERDMDGDTINALQITVQADVTTNTSQSDVRKVMAIVEEEFKRLRFQIIAMEEFDGSANPYRSTMRCKRIVGANDNLRVD